jgi:hypothetical protein
LSQQKKVVLSLEKTQVREMKFGKVLSEMHRGPTVKIVAHTQTLILCILLMGVVQLLNLVYWICKGC